MKFNRKNNTPTELLALHKNLLTTRLVEEKMFLWLRQGKISKWFSSYGQEAISVGATMALNNDEWVFTAHRNLGTFISREIPLNRLFSQFQGKNNGFTKGRDRSFHFGTHEYNICGMISHMASQLPVACGVAYGHQSRNENKVVIAFCGEGATSQGDFHEALNLAAVWQLPVIFIVENNGFAISTPVNEQFNCESIVDKAAGYGMDGLQIDGNNILEVFDTVKQVANNMRANPRPILIEALTFRMRGHEESSGTKNISEELLEKWSEKDPIRLFEDYLVKENIISFQALANLKDEIVENINQQCNIAENDSFPQISIENELDDVYKPHLEPAFNTSNLSVANIKFFEAIHQGLDNALEENENIVMLGQDIAQYGGVFKITEGLFEKHSEKKIRNTPLSESAIVGTAFGLSILGFKSIVEIQFSDFVTTGFNQIVNQLAKSHYRWGQNADVVIRMPTGAGIGAGPFHSQSTEAWFFKVPGLKIVYPSNGYDAKGLMIAAVNDPNPVLYFEHKALYRSIESDVPTDGYTFPIGKAKILKSGRELTVVTYGMGVIWAQNAVNELNMNAEIIDLCTLLPWDQQTVFESVNKTGKALILNEDTITGSISAEIASVINENCFSKLDAPVMRVGSLDTPIPFNKSLENQFLPIERLKQKLLELVNF